MALLTGVVLLAAGCGGGGGDREAGGGGTPRGGTGLTFWTAEDHPERLKATRAIVDRFQQQTNIDVELVAISEQELVSQIHSASAAGSLPDVLGALSLGFVHSLAADGITDPDAAAQVIDALDRRTFSERALSLVESDGKPVAIPSDSWTQLLIYRKDLFEKAGLAAPTTFAAIRTAAARLTGGGMVGIVAATKPDDLFTQQTFEYLAVANGCQLTDRNGDITLTSQPCVNTFTFYAELIRTASSKGAQDADTTRAAYFAGKAAMVIWSSFILDELAGLRADTPPTCVQCRGDRAFLSNNSGIVTAVQGPNGTEPAQFGELTSFAITKDADRDAARAFVEFMMNDGYIDWLALAPEGKFPLRTGTTQQPSRFTDAWNDLKTGPDRRTSLARIYPAAVLKVLTTSPETMRRWGFPQGQGRLVAAQQAELPVPRALAAALDGTLPPATAAEQAQADMEKIARPFR
jgi:multiple sugar transport system substrate-binding protein